MSEFIPITAKFNSQCLECLGEISSGDLIFWQKGVGTKHRECPEAIQKTHEIEVPEDYSTWKNQKTYSYAKVHELTECQKCNDKLTGKDIFLIGMEIGFMKICGKCTT